MQPWFSFLIFGALFFLMMRYGCGSHVMGHQNHHRSEDNRQMPTGGSSPPVGSAQVRDPVCGMTIERATAKTCEHGGAIHYFCSDQCRSKFEAAPEAFTASAA